MSQHTIQEAIKLLSESDHSPHDLSTESLDAFLHINPAGPYHFVNLLKFKQKASYPPDHPNAGKDIKGMDAYNIYGAVAFQQVTMRGGRLMTMNSVKFSMASTKVDDADWDAVATMEYKNIEAFLDMLLDPDYQKALVHRQAGLERTEILITRPRIDQPLTG